MMNEAQWQQVLAELKQKSNTLYAIAKMASATYKDDCVELSTTISFYRKRLAKQENLQTIANLASAVLSTDFRIKVTQGAGILGEAFRAFESAPPSSIVEDVSKSSVVNASSEKRERNSERIYLKHLHISNFRAITEADIELNPKVNVIIGANNIGKSAIVDAIRLALQVGKYRKTKFVSIEDFYDLEKEIAIDLKFFCPDSITGMPELKVFENDKDGKRVAYLELHIRYYSIGSGESRQVRQQFWGGNSGGKVPDDDALGIFSFEYLDALRDAKFVLRPSAKSKIAELLLNLRDGKVDRKKIEDVFEDAQKHPEVRRLVSEANDSVQGHVSKIALRNDNFNVNFKPLPPLFEELVGGFDIKLLSAMLTTTVNQNGLGYNNVLYASTVLGHIKSAHVRDPEMYHTLLIEEPEAHLHPQLEDSLFSYISKLGDKIGSQVIVTSHSPIISSTTNVDNLVIIHKINSKTTSTNLAKIELAPDEKRKISRYLDVTKSQLFFATAVIFVEGITEALLLSKLADVYFNEEDSLVARGIEIVDIDGVSFEPYAKLFNNSNYSLPMRAVILTDRDYPYTDKDDVYHDMSARSERALTFKKHNLDVQVTHKQTFECDLWEAGNEEIMKKAAKKLFPRSTFTSPEDILSSMDNSSIHGKGDLANEIVELNNTVLKVPKYIEKAFRWVDETSAI